MSVNIDRVVTKGGDGGLTSLGNGERVRKDALRVEAFGTVDEANAVIGMLRLHTRERPTEDASLARIQNDLFDLGADLCAPPAADGPDKRLRVTDVGILRLEAEVEAMNATLPPLTSFILPGGTPAAAYAHLARTVVRRAERLTVSLAATETVNPLIIRFLNRLSDHLFVLGRVLNAGSGQEVLWTPGSASRGRDDAS
ncbi:cob(I)yrinic acid a,c-diamide adenosyltransferase [Acidisoma cladoniae]|jgi:cob(I)alamin adenosyltransferase|uniref:cob(I)yrinic acid a,c-diamide adenosyltransferase n=1 Tax=Acidisoma cladoniae TaxID=3040935 RepID=UPI00254FB039|nr:cob(I)yrinic acid a,c-diamide adenosyltransferase [Acidisoma sp. PAMC 29798]